MPCRALHLAITDTDVDVIRAARRHGRIEAVQDLEETLFDTEFAYETDKAWDAIHRCLADGTLRHGGGALPINLAILGGEILDPNSQYILRLVTPAQAAAVADALSPLTESWLRERYFSPLLDRYEQDREENDFAYTWDYLRGLPAFFSSAAIAGRYVLFAVDQ